MSLQSQRGNNETGTKRSFTPRVSGRKNRNTSGKPTVISYDYDAAISQPEISKFLDFKKNTDTPRSIKRPLALRSKSLVRKNAKNPSPNNVKYENDTKETTDLSGASGEENETIQKENVTDNNRESLKESENFSNNDVQSKRAEIIERDEKNEIVEEKIKDEKLNNCETNVVKSPLSWAKGSKIPRAKTTLLPTTCNAVRDIQLDELESVSGKVNNCVSRRSSIIHCRLENIAESRTRIMKKISDKSNNQRTLKPGNIRTNQCQKSKMIKNDGENSGTVPGVDAEIDYESLSTDELPAITGNANNSATKITVLRSLKSNYQCRSCTDENLLNHQHEDTSSDMRSFSQVETRKKKWPKPLKHRKYIDTSSDEDFDEMSGEENIKTRKKCRNESINRQRFCVKSNLVASGPPKISTHRRRSISFFSTLFDIVFWPYLFLRTNH